MTLCAERRETKNSSQPHYYVQQLQRTCNRREPKNGLGVFPFHRGVVRGVCRLRAKMVVRVKTTKVKIEAARARTCPTQIKDGQGLGTQQNAARTD